jgi:SAM-dependent methyltransferase
VDAAHANICAAHAHAAADELFKATSPWFVRQPRANLVTPFNTPTPSPFSLSYINATAGTSATLPSSYGPLITIWFLIEALSAQGYDGKFDVVTAMEVVEHVANPHEFVQTICKQLRPGGTLFMSTMNRTPKYTLLHSFR